MSNHLAARLLDYLCGTDGLVGVKAYIWVAPKRRRWLNSAGLLLGSGRARATWDGEERRGGQA